MKGKVLLGIICNDLLLFSFSIIGATFANSLDEPFWYQIVVWLCFCVLAILALVAIHGRWPDRGNWP